LFSKRISPKKTIYNKNDKPSAISSITTELDLVSKEKKYISLARQH